MAKTVSMLELRQRAEEIVKAVRRGQSLVLTYRGRPVMRLEPLDAPPAAAPLDDPFFALATLDDHAGAPREALGNDEIDAIVYGK